MAGFLFRLETAEGEPANPPTLIEADAPPVLIVEDDLRRE
jgi:hypothetical protein